MIVNIRGMPYVAVIRAPLLLCIENFTNEIVRIRKNSEVQYQTSLIV